MAMEFSETDGFSEPNLSNGTENLTPLFEPTLNNNEFADGFIAEMTMGKDDFDHLLFGNTINAALKQTFNDPMSIESSLPRAPECSVLKNPSDSGFFDDSTIMSTDTDFESLATSPRSLYFSNSPFSSESGIEDDEEFEESKMESLEITQASAGFLDTQCSVPVSSSSYQNSSCPAAASLMPSPLNKVLEVSMQQEQKQQLQTESSVQASSVAAAYEELKQLLYTVASQSQTSSSLASLTTIMSDSSSNNIVLPNILPACTPNQGIGIMNVPISTPLSYTSATPATTQTVQASLSPVACSSSLIMTPCNESRTHVNPKYGRKTKKGREKPKLVILDEPEENYRARYESEGCRGPIHGSSDNTYPTIKVSGYTGPVWITVYLVTSSGQPHYHSIHGPGSTKVPCKEIKLPGDIPAVQLMVDPDSNMTAVLDSLSIRRLRNWEGDKELKKRGIDPRTWKRERKEARLLFQAEIPSCDGQPDVKLTCKSRIFQCSSSGPTGSPEIWWASRTEGAVEGKQEMGLIGKKFPSAFKVKFSAESPSGKIWESFAEVDKSKSHQGAAVLKTPPYCDQDILFPVKVNVEVVTGGNGKNGKCSEPIEFTYRPREEFVNATMTSNGHMTGQGGNLTGLQGGMTTTPQCFSSMATTMTAQATVASVVPMTANKQSDEIEWQNLCVQIKELQQKGELNVQQIRNLCLFIQRRDLLLLQAFRSANNVGTLEECRTKFKQYLVGLIGN